MHPPNFVIVGAPKCGTSALSEYLRGHPRVFVSKPKEPHFFADDFAGHRLIGTLDAYLELFADADPATHLAVGEASVFYLYSRAAIPNLAAFDPEIRLVVMVRNPVDLVHSMHSQLQYVLYEDEPDFAAAWELQAERAAGRHVPSKCRAPQLLQYGELGKMGEQLERALAVVPRERVRVIVFDDFKARTREIYRETLEFLGVEDDGRTEFPRVNANKQFRNRTLARVILSRPRVVEAPLRAVRRVLGVTSFGGIRKRMIDANVKRTPRQTMSPEVRKRVAEHFREDVEKLSRLLDRDLSGWLAPARGQDPSSV